MTAEELVVQNVAQAIYEVHWKEGAPRWQNVSPAVKEWVMRQAEAAANSTIEQLGLQR